MLLTTETRKYSGGPKVFKKEHLSKFFLVAKMKKTFAIMSQKLLHKL